MCAQHLTTLKKAKHNSQEKNQNQLIKHVESGVAPDTYQNNPELHLALK